MRLFYQLKILVLDCINEISRNGLKGLYTKGRCYLLDPRRVMVSQELAEWPARTEPPHYLVKSPAGITGLVSVVIPIYDRTWELRESIESILSQTYPDFELILVTDGSPQETMEVVEAYRCEPRVRIVSFAESSGTAVRGRNAGIAAARGEYVAFQDSDDVAEPERLALSVEMLKEGKADVVYGGWRILLEAERKDVEYGDGDVIIPPEFSVRDIFRNNRICQSTVMARAAMFRDIGGYKPEMRFREDHELWLRAAYYGYRFAPIQKVMTTLRLNQNNNTLNFLENDQQWYGKMLHEYKNRGPHITHREELP